MAAVHPLHRPSDAVGPAACTSEYFTDKSGASASQDDNRDAVAVHKVLFDALRMDRDVCPLFGDT